MTEKRYYYRDYEELYYIFDSNTISEKEFDEKEEYEGYTAFEDSLSSEEIVNLLNENEQLKIKLEDIALDIENAKESNDDAQYELYKIKKENEQLKQQLSSINQLIDNKIDEFKNGDYGDLPCNTIHMFLDLKQEIGDVE